MILTVIATLIIVYLIYDYNYKKTAYYQVTKKSLISVFRDLGRYGEYLTYKRLRYMEDEGAKFLFNVYIPKPNGETSEIDVLMICSKGIFVFESKNYSGWIFGSDNQQNWYQTLPLGRGKSQKTSFYNPVMQNRSHIKHLRNCLNLQIPIRSIIVFSDRCTLKNIKINDSNIYVINRYDIVSVVSSVCKQSTDDLLSESLIDEIYSKLYPLTQADVSVKKQHIQNIQNIQNKQSQNDYKNQALSDMDTSELYENEQINAESFDTDTSERFDTNTGINDSIETSQQTFQDKKCPRCGGNLVLRTTNRGKNIGKQFYGCSNFPKCKYTQQA